ncbi:hypothetical protein ACFL0C_00850 [Patescibacteria group bacterium]
MLKSLNTNYLVVGLVILVLAVVVIAEVASTTPMNFSHKVNLSRGCAYEFNIYANEVIENEDSITIPFGAGVFKANTFKNLTLYRSGKCNYSVELGEFTVRVPKSELEY